MAENTAIVYERGGSDEGPLLILLHGLGANGAVWDNFIPVLEKKWLGGWLIPDLRGHGRSFHRAPYSIEVHATDVAALPIQDEDVVLIGHSMGGAISFALATGTFGIRVRHVVAFGVKVHWLPDEIARAQAVANAPVRMFGTKDEATDRYLRVSGLKGIVGPDARTAELGVKKQDGQFRLASDPQINTIAKSDPVSLVAASKATIRLLTGAHDKVGTPEGMNRLGYQVKVLADLGHNLHVQAPETLWEAIESDF